MIDRQKGDVVFECDACGEVLETGVADSAAPNLMRREGWRSKKNARNGRQMVNLVSALKDTRCRAVCLNRISTKMKPLLLGMTNPRSADPAMALFPDPPGCAGWRLWKMMELSDGVTRDGYLAAFDRTNLVAGEWSAAAATRAATAFRVTVGDRAVVVLGAGVWAALRVGEAPAGVGQYVVDWTGALLYPVPHPSGKNHFYNDDKRRWDVGRFLTNLARAGCAA